MKATQSGLSKYRWKFENTDSVTTTTSTYSHTLKTGQKNVCLRVTELAGCTSETCKNVTVGIHDFIKQNGFKLYPNPNNGTFTIEIKKPEKNISIEIFVILGNLLKREETAHSKSLYTIDLNKGNGVYFVRIKNGEMVFYQKIILNN